MATFPIPTTTARSLPRSNVSSEKSGWPLYQLTKLVAAKQIDALLKSILAGPGDGNTTYEELRCVGYRPEDNTVTAVLTVKQGGGYSGRLCSNGSTEYVAFYFSPNNDGSNDTWQIDFIDQFPNCTVEIYNRWGELLFESVGYQEPWDGTYSGGVVPTGTYYYAIELNDERFPEPYTGPLTVIR